MTLPAVTDDLVREAEALARGWVREFRGDDDEFKISCFTTEAGRTISHMFVKQHAQSGPMGLLRVYQMARAGDATAGEVLLEWANECHMRGERMPPTVGHFQMEFNAGIAHLPGRNRADRAMRDLVFVAIVMSLVDRFKPALKATQSRTSRAPTKRPSACAILAKVAAELLPTNMILNTRGIEKLMEGPLAAFVAKESARLASRYPDEINPPRTGN